MASKSPLEFTEAATSGFSALILGSVVFLASPLGLILAAEVWSNSDKSPQVVHFHAWLARIGVGITSFVAIKGVLFAFRANRFRDENGMRSALARAGLTMSISALMLWILAAVALLNTTESLLQIYR